MKTLKLTALFLFTIILMNCRKDDDNPQPDPYSGFWAKKITYYSDNPSADPTIIELTYGNGRVTKMIYSKGSTTKELTIQYDSGITKIHKNGNLKYTFEYDISSKINKWSIYDDSGNFDLAYDIDYNDGVYSIIGGFPMITTQNEGELTQSIIHNLLNVSYNENPGIHQHVTLKPELYFLREISVFLHFVVSKREISTFMDLSGIYNMEVIRDSNDNITEMRARLEGTTAVKERWTIEYEQSTTIL